MRSLPATGVYRWCRGSGIWVLGLLLVMTSMLRAQSGDDRGGRRLDRYGGESIRPVLTKISVEGNEELGTERIKAQIQSRETQRPVIRRFFSLFVLPAELPFIPVEQRDRLRKTVDSLAGDIRYLNMATVGADTTTIREFYEDHGFHDARVRFKILLDTSNNTAELRFIVNEGAQYPLRGIHYLGLDTVPAVVREQIERPELLKLGDPYSKDNLTAERDRVIDVLKNNGYAFATSGTPTVFQIRKPNPDAPYDSALIFLYTDTRYHFGETDRVRDSADKPPFVNDNVVMRQIDYAPGEWYSRQKIDQTISNLYALGTFDIVRLDTAADLSRGDTLGMRIHTKLRPPRDFRASVEYSIQRRIDEYVSNLGLTSTFSIANLTGNAERFSLTPYVRMQLPSFRELQYGGALSVFLPAFLSNRLNLIAAGSYDYSIEDRLRAVIRPTDIPSLRAEDVTLFSRRWSPSLEGTYRFPSYTYLSYAIGRFQFQWTKYYGISDYITRSALDQLAALKITFDPNLLRDIVVKSLVRNIFRVQVLQGDSLNLINESDPGKEAQERERFDDFKGSWTFGLSAVSDKRNDLFAPTRGHFMQAGVDLGLTGTAIVAPIGAFAKGNFDYRWYTPTPWSNRASFALRGHIGAIIPFGSLPLIPAAQRFTAGGASSIRGWGPREMLATTVQSDSTLTAGISPELRNTADSIIGNIFKESKRLLGGLAILELSAEWRMRMFNLGGTGILARQLNQLGLNIFVDAGNAFFRDYQDDKGLKILQNIGLSIGLSIGYDTPVGPFQVGYGYPLYDPVNHSGDERWVFGRPLMLSDGAWQVSIGYSF